MSYLTYNTNSLPGVELKPKQCIDAVLEPVRQYPHQDQWQTCRQHVLHTAVSMAVNNASVHSISKHYKEAPCETSMRHHLNKLAIDELILINSRLLLQGPLKNLNPKKTYEFAIDYTNDPYYGEIDTSNEKYVIRSQAKKSTNSFYSYVSLSIINKNERFTISVLPVEKDKSKVDYLTYFIDLINELNFNIKVLFLDREFYTVDVFEFLQDQKIPHITPVVRRGDKMKKLLIGKKARSAEYVLTNSKKKKILLNIVIDVKYLKGKRNKKGCENPGFVVYGVNLSPGKVSGIQETLCN